jgi:hypothetical protein
MKVSKIQSKATYHKCIRELNDFGYLSYHPSYNPFKGSLVYLFNFQSAVNKVNKQPKIETSSELAVNGYRTKNETSTEQALVPYINNTNNTKQQTEVNGHSQKKSYEKNNQSSKVDSSEYAGTRKKSAGAAEIEERLLSEGGSFSKTDSSEYVEASRQKRPLREEVRIYFFTMQWPEQEAVKFYNYYESNGWLVGGKSTMLNWQASAQNWMINSCMFNGTESASTKLTKNSINKNYSEPL